MHHHRSSKDRKRHVSERNQWAGIEPCVFLLQQLTHSRQHLIGHHMYVCLMCSEELFDKGREKTNVRYSKVLEEHKRHCVPKRPPKQNNMSTLR